MDKSFYTTERYRGLQRSITTNNWALGKFSHLRKRIHRKCLRPGCVTGFILIPSNPKEYCSKRCAALVNNAGRLVSRETRSRIASALIGKPNPRKGEIIIPRIERICFNINCKRLFFYERWKNKKFCSKNCAIKDIGSHPTSPRAARAKAGIRIDIDPRIYFFSRWEANYARLLNFQKIPWVHQPKTFRLKKQNYTPDFYLPRQDRFVEIKNFLSDYSKNRDEEFRELYPDIRLDLILKEDYLKLQDKFSSKIKTWEYS